jgi:hypothetical protein
MVSAAYRAFTESPQDHDCGTGRKLLIALWRLAHEGVVPEGVAMRPA